MDLILFAHEIIAICKYPIRSMHFNGLRDITDVQVKTIPVLEVRISVLQQEKKRLLSELANVDPSATQRFAVDCDGNAKEENGTLGKCYIKCRFVQCP